MPPSKTAPKGKAPGIIRIIYLYLVTAISIVVILISAIGVLNVVLSEYVLKVQPWSAFDNYAYYECTDPYSTYYAGVITDDMLEYDEFGSVIYPELTDEQIADCEADVDERNRLSHLNDVKRDLTWYLSMLLVALPLYLYHWGVIRKEHK